MVILNVKENKCDVTSVVTVLFNLAIFFFFFFFYQEWSTNINCQY